MRTELGLAIDILVLDGGIKVHHSLPVVHLLGILHLSHLLLLLLMLPIIYKQIWLLSLRQVLQLDLWGIVHDLLSLSLEIGVVLVQQLANLRDLRCCQIAAE